jgi:hypothetical protein
MRPHVPVFQQPGHFHGADYSQNARDKSYKNQFGVTIQQVFYSDFYSPSSVISWQQK